MGFRQLADHEGDQLPENRNFNLTESRQRPEKRQTDGSTENERQTGDDPLFLSTRSMKMKRRHQRFRACAETRLLVRGEMFVIRRRREAELFGFRGPGLQGGFQTGDNFNFR